MRYQLPKIKIRLSFQAKVLIPMLVMMVLLTQFTAWLVDRRITDQLIAEATDKLGTAEAVFKNFDQINARNLLLRYRNYVNEPRVKANVQKADPGTIRQLFSDFLQEDQTVGVMMFTSSAERPLAFMARDHELDPVDFEAQSLPAVRRALEREATVDIIASRERLFNVVCIPVLVGNQLKGVLTYAIEIGPSLAQELRQLTHTEIAFLIDDRVIASTLSPRAQRRLPKLNVARGLETKIDGEHFLYTAARFPTLSGGHALKYQLLFSYEKSLQALVGTQNVLLAARLAALFGAAMIVYLILRRVMQPLRELRASAEAIRNGDFSQRVRATSQDECAELAEAFNRMTESLEETIARLKKMQAQLVQSEKLAGIGEFVAGVTHELNNPLTSVIGFAELLQNTELEAGQKRHLDFIVKSARRCQKIVQSLLSFARQHKPERKLVNVHDLVEAALEILAYQMRTSNIKVTTRFDPALVKVMGDPHQLQQVFLNIINNARQAIEEFRKQGELDISTSTVNGKVRIEIKDNGPGITEENLKRIFDPFFTTKQVGKGTGLGLSLCYGIIQEHTGTIVATSKVGEGTTFTIEIPAAPANAAPSKQTEFAMKAAGNFNGRGKRVLVVDDEEAILALVRDALGQTGVELDMARDGETALKQMRLNTYDATICDWRMPGMNGQQVYEQLRSFDLRAAERMIFVTGDVVNEKTQSFIKERGNLALGKPFTLNEIRDAVRQVIESGTAIKPKVAA
ncbi:MAG TPA: ATP-binding protein [Verrucomicrobiae bacterium]|nr:ATP-binding protein [Verrucomicrobiae bacterium]